MVEITIAIVIFLLAVIPLSSLIQRSNVNFATQERELTDLLSAQNLLNQIKSKKWDENVTSTNTYVNASATLAPESGETDVSLFDDIDDFNGYTVTQNDLTLSVDITYVVSSTATNQLTVSASSTSHKLIRVNATHDGAKPYSHNLMSLRSNGL